MAGETDAAMVCMEVAGDSLPSAAETAATGTRHEQDAQRPGTFCGRHPNIAISRSALRAQMPFCVTPTCKCCKTVAYSFLTFAETPFAGWRLHGAGPD